MKVAVLAADSTLRTAAAEAAASEAAGAGAAGAGAAAVSAAAAAAATATATATATARAVAVVARAVVVVARAAATSLRMILAERHPGTAEEFRKMCISPVTVEQLVDRSGEQTGTHNQLCPSGHLSDRQQDMLLLRFGPNQTY